VLDSVAEDTEIIACENSSIICNLTTTESESLSDNRLHFVVRCTLKDLMISVCTVKASIAWYTRPCCKIR
jgi:hypothetical protein